MSADMHFSIDDFIDELERQTSRPLAFQSETKDEWILWRSRLRSKLFELMEPLPEPAPPNLRILESVDLDGIIRHKVVYSTEAAVDVPAFLFVPDGAGANGSLPGLVALHGHGIGKDSVSGESSGDEPHNNYALEFAKRGHIVLAPDARGFGERSEGFGQREPGQTTGIFGSRDGCNVSFLKTMLFGINLMSRNIWDDIKAVDVLSSNPAVDADRVGCVGLSFGGTRTMYLAAVDPRIKVAVMSGYLTTFAKYALEMGNFCGSQFLPGIYRYADVPDIVGAIAPRPLLVEAGIRDSGFPVETSREAHKVLERIYAVAGASDRLARDEFDAGHQFSGRLAFDFVGKWL
jgi:dienelactone hydrolase